MKEFITELKLDYKESEVFYLDLIYEKPKESKEPEFAPEPMMRTLDDSINDAQRTTMSLERRKQTINISKKITDEELLDDLTLTLIVAGTANIQKGHTMMENFHIIDNEILSSYRKLLSRILMASTLIAHKTRMGPGHFAFIHSDIDKILNENEDYKKTKTLGGLKFIVNDRVGNCIVVFRKVERRNDFLDQGFYIAKYRRFSKVQTIGHNADATVVTLEIV